MNTIPCRQLETIRDTAGHDLGGQCQLGRRFPDDCCGCGSYDPVIADADRQLCEVWTRVMGYHRPISAYNAGKRAEHAERVAFKEPSA